MAVTLQCGHKENANQKAQVALSQPTKQEIILNCCDREGQRVDCALNLHPNHLQNSKTPQSAEGHRNHRPTKKNVSTGVLRAEFCLFPGVRVTFVCRNRSGSFGRDRQESAHSPRWRAPLFRQRSGGCRARIGAESGQNRAVAPSSSCIFTCVWR